MQLHTLSLRTRRKSAKYIGRGGKRGTTAGRGTKGQRARAGHKIRPAIRDIIKKLPKLRGYRFKSYVPKPSVFDLRAIQKHFKAGETVSPGSLRKKGLLPKARISRASVKIVDGGAFDVKNIVFRGVGVSTIARERILGNGGSIHDK